MIEKIKGKNKKKILIFSLKSSYYIFHRKVGYYPPNKKFLDNFAITCDFEDQKAIFFKKCLFWPENDVFSKNLFYSKLIRDQNYIMCTCQKIHFQNKIMRLQFSPDSTYIWHLHALNHTGNNGNLKHAAFM